MSDSIVHSAVTEILDRLKKKNVHARHLSGLPVQHVYELIESDAAGFPNSGSILVMQSNFQDCVDPVRRRTVFGLQRECLMKGRPFIETPFYLLENIAEAGLNWLEYPAAEMIDHAVESILESLHNPEMPVTVTKIFKIAYGHKLENQHLDEAQNKIVFGLCNGPHGHNMQLEVTVKGWVNPATGMLINFTELKEVVAKSLTDKLDHAWLNDVYGDEILTTCEVTTPLMLEKLLPALPNISRLRVYETDSSFCEIER